MEAVTYSTRYVAYARAHGKTPEQMGEFDEESWPGGCMTGFILWISQKWRAWGDSVGGMPDVLSAEHHAHFDAFIS